MVLLEKSARAYAKLQSFSMRFTDMGKDPIKAWQSSGVLIFSRPNQAKIQGTLDGKPFQVVTDGKVIRSMRNPQSYQTSQVESENPLQSVIQQIPASVSLPLNDLVAGQNPLAADSSIWWENVALLPPNGVAMTARFGPNTPPLQLRLFFDRKSALLRRVESMQVYNGSQSRTVTTLTRLKRNPKFAANDFVFTPPQSAKEEIQRPFYDPKLKIGAMPRSLTSETLQGQPLSIESYRGQVVLLDFWATWCGPCVEEIPNLLSNYDKYRAKGLEILSISLDEDKQAVIDFVAARRVSWPQLFGGKGLKSEDALRYGIRVIPLTLLIGRDGKIAAVNPRGPQLERAIQKALQ